MVVIYAVYLHGMGAPLITSSSRSRYDRNIWGFLLNRTKDVVGESLVMFKNWITDFTEKLSQREKWL